MSHAFSELFTIFLKYWKETTKVYEKMPRHVQRPQNLQCTGFVFSLKSTRQGMRRIIKIFLKPLHYNGIITNVLQAFMKEKKKMTLDKPGRCV